MASHTPVIGKEGLVLIRTSAGLCALALVFAAGCGDDEERSAATTSTGIATGAATETQPATVPEAGATDTTGRETSPEDQPGGAGDEEAARSEAVLEFGSAGLSPEEVRVPPFIPVVLIVRSDGTEYDLTYRAPSSGGGANGTTEADFEIDGLRPGQEIEVVERNTDTTATVVASDDVGP